MNNRYTHTLLQEHALGLAAIKTTQQQKIAASQLTLSTPNTHFLGRHVLAEFDLANNVEAKALLHGPRAEKKLLAILIKAANVSGATILCSESGRTPAGDLWAITVIQESHFSIHFRLKDAFIALDGYTCGPINLENAIAYLQSALKTQPYDAIEFKRGISQQDERFVPGIAVSAMATDKTPTLKFFQNVPTVRALGQHGIAEYHGCHPDKINDSSFVLHSFRNALAAGGMRDFTGFQFAHKFKPQGVSAVMIGQGIHLTIHDWPEHGYASVDLCVFNKIDIHKVLTSLKMQWEAQNLQARIFPRGVVERGSLKPVFKELLPADKEIRQARLPN